MLFNGNNQNILSDENVNCVLNIVCLQVKRIEKFTRSVCEVARSIGCGEMGKKVFEDRNEEKK